MKLFIGNRFFYDLGATQDGPCWYGDSYWSNFPYVTEARKNQRPIFYR